MKQKLGVYTDKIKQGIGVGLFIINDSDFVGIGIVLFNYAIAIGVKK